jgi:hypothetical protein
MVINWPGKKGPIFRHSSLILVETGKSMGSTGILTEFMGLRIVYLDHKNCSGDGSIYLQLRWLI